MSEIAEFDYEGNKTRQELLYVGRTYARLVEILGPEGADDFISWLEPHEISVKTSVMRPDSAEERAPIAGHPPL